MGGKPSITMMRRTGDDTLDAHIKEKYRTFLAGKIKRSVPAAEVEAANQAEADAFYEQCGIWIRDRTRNAKKFPILFNELVTYGFRRNLLGLKWSALTLNLVVVAISCGLLWQRGIWDMTDELAMRATVVLLVACIHALYIAFVVTSDGVKEAARKYARELILSCETLTRTATTTALPRRPRGKATTT